MEPNHYSSGIIKFLESCKFLSLYVGKSLIDYLKNILWNRGYYMEKYLAEYDVMIPSCLNFTYKELIKSDSAIRHGIKNIPDKRQLKNIQLLAQNVLQPLRNELGRIRVTSGFRSPELNSLIGGSPTSNHCLGYAADIESLDNISLLELLNYIYDNLPFKELIAEFFPDGWVHVAYKENNNNRILKLKDDDHNYKIVTIEYINSLYK